MSCLFLTESSHDIVESSRYIPHDYSHMRTTEIDLNTGAIMAKKILTMLKSVPLMLKRNAFGCIVFERRVGQYYLCVEILLYSPILFTSKFNDHMMAAMCPYEIPGIFKRHHHLHHDHPNL